MQTVVLRCFSEEPLQPLLVAKAHIMASDGGCRSLLMSPCAFIGFADEGMILLNTEGQRNSGCPQEFQMTGGTSFQGPGGLLLYSGGGRRLRSCISSSPFQYLKLLSRCCTKSGRSTKASQASNMSVMK